MINDKTMKSIEAFNKALEENGCKGVVLAVSNSKQEGSEVVLSGRFSNDDIIALTAVFLATAAQETNLTTLQLIEASLIYLRKLPPKTFPANNTYILDEVLKKLDNENNCRN